MLHLPVDGIGKLTYIQTLEEAGNLYDGSDSKISDGKRDHRHACFIALEDFKQCLGKLAFIIWPGEQADVIDQTCDGNDHQKLFLMQKVTGNFLRIKLFFSFHDFIITR